MEHLHLPDVGKEGVPSMLHFELPYGPESDMGVCLVEAPCLNM